MSKEFDDLLKESQKDVDYWIAAAKLDYSIELNRLMQSRPMRNVDLAIVSGKSKSFLTRVFRGNSNLTIDTMVRLAHAAGGTVHIHVEPEEKAATMADQAKAVVITQAQGAITNIPRMNLPVSTGLVSEQKVIPSLQALNWVTVVATGNDLVSGTQIDPNHVAASNLLSGMLALGNVVTKPFNIRSTISES